MAVAVVSSFCVGVDTNFFSAPFSFLFFDAFHFTKRRLKKGALAVMRILFLWKKSSINSCEEMKKKEKDSRRKLGLDVGGVNEAHFSEFLINLISQKNRTRNYWMWKLCLKIGFGLQDLRMSDAS